MFSRFEVIPDDAPVSVIKENVIYFSNSGHSVAYGLAGSYLIQFKAGLHDSSLFVYPEEDDSIEYIRYKRTPTIKRMTVGQMDLQSGWYNKTSVLRGALMNRAVFYTKDKPDTVLAKKPYTYCPAPRFADGQISNLAQLKAALTPGVQFRMVRCKNRESQGTLRTVNLAGSNHIYIKVTDEPEHFVSICNGGRGIWLAYSNASFYSFGKTIKCYAVPGDEKTLIYEMKIEKPAKETSQ